MLQKEKALPFIHGAKWSKWCISSWLAISNVKLFYHFSPVEILHTWFISVVEIPTKHSSFYDQDSLHICIYLSNSNNFQFNLRNVLVLKRINYRISTTAIIISPFLWLMQVFCLIFYMEHIALSSIFTTVEIIKAKIRKYQIILQCILPYNICHFKGW